MNETNKLYTPPPIELKCHCPCHTDARIKHAEPCCQNGKVILESQEVFNGDFANKRTK